MKLDDKTFQSGQNCFRGDAAKFTDGNNYVGVAHDGFGCWLSTSLSAEVEKLEESRCVIP